MSETVEKIIPYPIDEALRAAAAREIEAAARVAVGFYIDKDRDAFIFRIPAALAEDVKR